MKLLLDQNLSPRLCDRLRDVWPEVVHVRAVGLAAADDSAVWAYARQHDFAIVSKDGDFSGRASLFGAPPKVRPPRSSGICATTIKRSRRS